MKAPYTFRGKYRDDVVQGILSRTPFRLNDQVRVYFGDKYKDGRIEALRPDGKAHVRLEPGWLHIEPIENLARVPKDDRTAEAIWRDVA